MDRPKGQHCLSFFASCVQQREPPHHGEPSQRKRALRRKMQASLNCPQMRYPRPKPKLGHDSPKQQARALREEKEAKAATFGQTQSSRFADGPPRDRYRRSSRIMTFAPQKGLSISYTSTVIHSLADEAPLATRETASHSPITLAVSACPLTIFSLLPDNCVVPMAVE